MVKYLVKTTMVATPENRSFAGEMCIYYHGKGCKMVACVGEHAKKTYTYQRLNKYMAGKYGYSRECDAKRSWDYRNPQNDRSWTATTEIVRVVI